MSSRNAPRKRLKVTVASFNMLKSITDEQARSDLARVLMLGPDVVSLQEARPHLGTVAEVSKQYGYLLVIGQADRYDPAAGNVPILIRGGWFLTGTPEVRLGCPAGGPGLPARYMLKARLRHGHTLFGDLVVINTYLDSHVEMMGMPRPLPRIRLYREHMRNLVEFVDTRAARRIVVATADYNVDQRRDRGLVPFFPKAAFAKIGAVSNYSMLGFPSGGGTLHSRYIDAVFVREPDPGLVHRHEVSFVEQSILRGFYSDHEALFVDLEVIV